MSPFFLNVLMPVRKQYGCLDLGGSDRQLLMNTGRVWIGRRVADLQLLSRVAPWLASSFAQRRPELQNTFCSVNSTRSRGLNLTHTVLFLLRHTKALCSGKSTMLLQHKPSTVALACRLLTLPEIL